jgi:hypothetical protein
MCNHICRRCRLWLDVRIKMTRGSVVYPHFRFDSWRGSGINGAYEQIRARPHKLQPDDGRWKKLPDTAAEHLLAGAKEAVLSSY